MPRIEPDGSCSADVFKDLQLFWVSREDESVTPNFPASEVKTSHRSISWLCPLCPTPACKFYGIRSPAESLQTLIGCSLHSIHGPAETLAAPQLPAMLASSTEPQSLSVHRMGCCGQAWEPLLRVLVAGGSWVCPDHRGKLDAQVPQVKS